MIKVLRELDETVLLSTCWVELGGDEIFRGGIGDKRLEKKMMFLLVYDVATKSMESIVN